MFRDGGGEQCRGACSEVLPEELKEAEATARVALAVREVRWYWDLRRGARRHDANAALQWGPHRCGRSTRARGL